MDEEDEIALKQINARLPQGIEPCSEDHFEEVMNFFEETTQAKQPYANVGNAPVLTLPELEEHYDDTVPASVPRYSKYIYEHWKNRRTAVSNHSLEPHLKFETGQETDDADPYVCFRRRELRQIRKTRNRDAQSADKLRKLRLELETARNLLLMVKKREQMRKEVLEIDRLVFEQRLQFRDTKRKLGRAGDEDLLINQKVSILIGHIVQKLTDTQKQRLPPTTSPGQHLLPSQVRMPVGSGASDLRTLEDVRADRQKNVDNEIQVNIEKHIRWNEGWVDKTRAPLTPEAEVSFAQQEGAFREAMAATEYLPTPPASISDEESTQPQEVMDAEPQKDPTSSTPFRYASPADEGTDMPMPSFRRRTGRGGRQWIDRKFPIRSKRDRDDDRFKFDSDGEDVDMVDAVEEDPIWTRMSQRAYLLGTGRPHESQVPSRRATIEPGSSTNHSSPQVPVAQQTTAAS